MGETVEEKLNRTFNIQSVTDEEDSNLPANPEEIPEENSENSEFQLFDSESYIDDFEEAREILSDTVRKASGALDELLDIAKDTDDPRAYDAVSKMVSSITSLAKEMTTIQRNTFDMQDVMYKRKERKDKADNSNIENTYIQNNIIFSGKTHDLLKEIRGQGEVYDHEDK